jgi:hypothetical protein
MSNHFTYQVLRDTTQDAIIKLTGFFDGSSGDESNSARIQANTLYGALNANTVPDLLSNGGAPLPYYGLSVERIWYNTSISSPGHLRLTWSADTPQTILGLPGYQAFEYNGMGNWITIPNNAKGTANCKGDIGITTFGAGAEANTTYNIIIGLRKDNLYYQRGQFNDPAAFNYGPYSLKP